MKKINTRDAVGHTLAHDITRIVPGEFKGRAFKKGHLIKEEDIEKLLELGKDNIYILEINENSLHENDAALILGYLGAGENIEKAKEIKEGKLDFFASKDGVLKVNKELLFKLNMLGEISFATLSENVPVKKGQKVAGARVIPLVIKKEKLEKAKEIVTEKILSIKEIKRLKIAVVTTGNEVFYKRIEDKFGPIIDKKAHEYSCEIIGQTIVPDDKEKIKEAILKYREKGAEVIICTGGMSVDPDDLTPSSIIELGGDLVSYGSPVLPGSMFLLSYLDGLPIMGLPGCVMYSKRTVFDLIFPRVLSGERLEMEDIMRYGHGGLCMNCDICTYPNCSFGK